MTSSFPNSISNLKEFISKTDDDGHLQVYSYNYCDNNSCNDLKKCRGLIFNGDNLLFNSLGFTPEYNDSDQETLSKEPLEKYTFFPSEEGTLLRVFYNNHKWYISTHRKLDAFNSRWGSQKSFGEIFTDSLKTLGYESLDQLTTLLDKNSMYLFFIRNTLQNKIVSNPPNKNLVYFVGHINYSGISLSNKEYLDFPTQQPLLFENWEQVFEYVRNVNPREEQGVLAFYKDQQEFSQFKIVNSSYKLMSQVRGNEPNLSLRYLQVRSHPIYSKMIYELYPEHVNFFIQIENIIIKIAKNIHNAYVSRFVNKNYTVVSQEEYVIIKECHGWHILDRKNNKVTLSQVINYLNKEQYVNILYTLVTRFK